jgi:BlaI family transcriptional regulator, penicillinase repressor
MNAKVMKEITRAQEEILQILWDINEGMINDIMEVIPEPRPAYNTVSTVVRVLEKKGYVKHRAYGKTHVYYPVVSKKEYAQHWFKDTLHGFFNNSLTQVVSFYSKNNDLSLSELEEIKKMIEEQISLQKK